MRRRVRLQVLLTDHGAVSANRELARRSPWELIRLGLSTVREVLRARRVHS